MATGIAFPAQFGRPRQNGYEMQRAEQIRSLTPMSGSSRYRLLTTEPPLRVSVSFVFDDERWAAFQRFWDVDLMSGVNWFDMDLMLGTGTSVNQTDANTFKSYETHFMDNLSASIAGYNWWQVSQTLEVRNWKNPAPALNP